MSFVDSEFLVSQRRLCTLRHFYSISQLELCLTTINESFTREGAYPYLLLPDTSFLYHFIQLRDSVRRRPTVPSPPNQTPNVVLIITMHLHPFNAMSQCICNAMRHDMLYHATCIINAIWTTQSIPLTWFYGQSHHLHMTFILHFIHVNNK